ncbi:hemicentin-2-like isoform X2 [Gigantopelta aegis]|uniref:hemicentin-2-like isoform X2 n=1 Tax=Gigantopelta aegis TaxID=1735272 RepID=UPI001B8889F8|nr:hemicentin-2-like isoform X2 [Gigantopelta aegis]
MGTCTVCLFTLALTFLTTCTQGQVTSHDGLPVIKTHPHENYYIVKRKPVTVTCEAYDAMQITFHCSGQDIEAAKQENFQTFDPESGRILAKSSIRVTQDDVRRHRGKEYWCECYAWAAGGDDSSHSGDRRSQSRRGVISVSYIKRKFIEQPGSQTTEVGSKVLMKCSPPEAHPTPEIFWRKDKRRLSPEADNNVVINDDGSLVIHVVRKSDAGEYSCIARNPSGRRESRSGTLTVKDKSKVHTKAKADTNEGVEQSASDSPAAISARFLEEPDSMYYVTRSRPVTITCTVKGAEVLDFRCNGRRIPEEKIEKQRSETRVASERVIKVRYDIVAQEVEEHARTSGGGDFSCECHSWFLQDGKWASVQSMTGVVKMASLGDRFVQDPADQMVKPGSTVKFTCQPPEGNPTPEITWMRNGAAIDESQFRNLRVRDGVLTLTRVTRRDMADFSCTASNIAGTRNSGAARLTVSERAVVVEPDTTTEMMTSGRPTPPPDGAPIYLTNLDDYYYVIGHKPATLTCKVQGADNLRFRCNNRRLAENQQQVNRVRDDATGEMILEGTTTVSRAQLERYAGQGEFTCECVAWYTEMRTWKFLKSNKATVAFAHLKRRFQKQPTDMVLNVGGVATFECLAPEGNPKPMIYWSKDRTRLDVDSDDRIRVLLDGGQLEISNVRTSDAGRYTCEAENPAGVKMSRPAVLTVEGDDVDRTDLESSTAQGTSAESTPEPEPETTAEPPATTESNVPELVPGVPIFIKEPKQVYYIVRDSPITITCRTLGAEHLMFNCNGKRIPEGINDTYTAIDPETGFKILERSIQVQRSEVENSDNYECDCTAWYALPNAQDWNKMPKKTMIEIAYIKKRFMQEPVSQSVQMHVTTEIPCSPPKANPEPKVYWLKDNEKIMEADDPNFTVTSSGSLVIREMHKEDAGTYVCVAENVAGKRMSSAIQITVYDGEAGPEPTPEGKEEEEVKTVQPVVSEATDGPPVFLQEPDSMSYVVKGKSTVLSCQAEKTGKITFYCNDAHVDPSRVTLTETVNDDTQKHSLVATYGVTREDIAQSAGGSEYTCQCFAWYRMSGDSTDQFVSSRSGVAVLAFIKGPSVKEAKMETGDAGQLVSLKCSQAKGTPWPKVSWQKDGELIDVMEDSNLVIPNDGSLVILKARLADSGRYACISENVAGRKQSALVDLTIKGPEMTTTAEPEHVPEISVPIGSIGENVTDSMYNDTEVTPLPESSPEAGISEVNVTESVHNSTEYVIVKSELETENTTVAHQTTPPSYKNITDDDDRRNVSMTDIVSSTSGWTGAGETETASIPEVIDNTTMEETTGGASVPDSEPEPTSEPESTPESSAESTSEADHTTPNINECMTMFRECNAILNEKSVDTSSDPSAMCKVRVNYTKCTDNFMDVCSGFIRPELMETMTTTREGFDKYCKSSSTKPDKDAEMAFPGCRKLQMCYSKFRSEINMQAILYSCVALQNYLHCAEDAITICNIQKPSDTKTTLSDIAGWFSEYCSRIPLMDKGLKRCEKRDVCKLPLSSNTTAKQTINVNHWCPFLHSTVACTQVIVSECVLKNSKNLESDIHYLNTQAHKHCPTGNNEHPEGGVVGQTKDAGNENAAASTVISTFAATLLPILAALVIAYR